MISLQQLLGQEDRFFELFEASAEECRNSVKALKTLAAAPDRQSSLAEFIDSRRRDKHIHTQLSEALCSNVVTALERDDIVALASSLYKIPKTIEKIAERIQLAPHFLAGFNLAEQTTMLEQATDTLLTMLRAMHRRAGIQEVKQHNDHLQALEGNADKQVVELLRVLYSGEMEGRRVVFLKDLFELFEHITDRCRDAGNVVVQIVLKNS